ncbi:helix-turn-helix domain-containing protein [Sphaerisporangium melleum]|nr:helix-turn-helix transcriptional regulator [Sphaerisporangium melleum]
MSRPGADVAYETARVCYELGKAVRLRRTELGTTQSELARRAGVERQEIARFEAGGTMPTIPMLQELAEALESRLTVRFEPRGQAN